MSMWERETIMGILVNTGASSWWKKSSGMSNYRFFPVGIRSETLGCERYTDHTVT